MMDYLIDLKNRTFSFLENAWQIYYEFSEICIEGHIML